MSDVTIGNGTGTYDLSGSQGGVITVGNGSDTVVVAGGSGETITVGNGSDSLTVDGATGDSIKIGNGSDTVTVSGGSGNTIVAGNGSDTVVASAEQNDTITVGNGQDTVYAGANDTITVGKGGDTVVLPSSIPTLTAPASITVLEDNSIGMAILAALSPDAFGQETINGFAAGDKIEVSTAQFANFSAVLADAKQVGQNTVITAAPSDTITLDNFQLSSLKSNNVVFTSGGLAATVSLTIGGMPVDATLSSAADPNGVSYDSSTNTWTVAAGALPDLTLHAGEVTTATLTVTATDSATGDSVSHTIALTVDPVAPTLTAPASLTVVQGQTVALGVSETPYDARDVVSLKVTGIPADATLSAGTRNSDGSWTLTPGQLTGLTLTAGAATATSLTVTATNTLGITASTSDTIALTVTSPASISVALSVPGGGAVQQGQSLLALATITGDAADLGATVTYQWQSSSNGGQTWTNVAATAAGTFGGVAGSLYQLTEADEGKIFRAEASFTDDTGHVVSSASAPTVAVADITPEITVPFSYAVDDLSIIKNGTQIYNDTFNQAPPASSTILSNGAPTQIAYLTEGGTWTESGGKAVISSSGAAANPAVAGGVYDFALLNTNTDPSSGLGLKLATDFTVSSIFDLTTPTSGSYGMELTDGTPTHGTDQLERLVVARVNGNAVVELTQGVPGAQTVVASQTLTSADLAGNNQIEFQLTHVANAQTVSGSFELIDNGTVTSTVDFTPTASVFTNGVDWTRVDIGAFMSEGVGLNVGAGQAIAAGQTLTARAATNDADATIHYQWEKSSSAAFTSFTNVGTDSASYVVQAADAGWFIRVVATTSDPDSGQSATATSQVTGSVHLPSATPDSSVVFQDNLGDDSTSLVSGNVLSNDAGAIAGDQLRVTAVNGNAAAVGSAVIGTYGTLRLSADGSYSYQLADGQANVEGLTFGHTVTDTFAYTATDSFGTPTSATINIVIDPSNTAPVIVAAGTTATGFVTESPANVPETVHTISGTVAFTDENLLDTHAPAIFVPAAGNYGNMSVVLDTDSTGGATGTATWTYTVSDAALDPLAQGQTATDTFDVLIPDPNGGIANQPITITLTGSNDTPVVQTPDQNLAFTVDSAPVFTASGSSSFTDVDLTDTHVVSASLQSATLSNGAALPTGLTATLATALSATLQTDDSQFVAGQYGWNFSLSNDAVDFLAQGEVLNLTYQIDTTDPFGGVGVQNINVAITGVEQAPTITTPAIAGTAQEGQTLTASATAGNGDSISYSWYSSADGYTNPIATGATYQVKDTDEGAALEVTATATNGNGASVSATSAATNPVLDAAPTVTTPIIVGTAQEGQILTVSAASGQGDNPVSYVWYSSADGYANSIGTGTAYAVQEGDEGFTIEVTATATNDAGATVSASSAPTAAVLDAAPSVSTPIIAGTAQEGQTLTASATAGQTGSALSYAWYSSVDGYTNPIGSGASYVVQESDEGHQLRVVATSANDNGATASQASAPTASVIDMTSVPVVTIAKASTSAVAGLPLEGLQSFSQFLGFGDSNIDSGYFFTHTISNNPTLEAQYQASVAAGGGLPTSLGGTMNSQLLAADYGLTATPVGEAGGTNYAASGATVTGSLHNSLAPSITSQIQSYLASTNNVADPNALYLISGGGNDTKIAATLSGEAAQNAFMVSEANALVSALAQLQAAGARNIVVDDGAATNALGAVFNDTLWAGLDAAGVHYVVADVTALDRQVAANPAQFSSTLTDTTRPPAGPFTAADPYNPASGGADINPNPSLIANSWGLYATTMQSADAGQTNLWADDEHLAAVGQQIEANYDFNLIQNAVPTPGETLTATPSLIGEPDNATTTTVTYQWQHSFDNGATWTAISGATGKNYTVKEADEGARLRVNAAFTDDTGDVVMATSPASLTVAEPPPALTAPASLTVGEDTTTQLPISVSGDADDATSVTIAGLPSDASLSVGTRNADGSWTLTAAQLDGGVNLNAGEDLAAPVTLSVTATSTGDGQTTSSSANIALSITPVAETPNLSIANPAPSVVEGGTVGLGLAVSGDADDGLSVTITGVPSNVSLGNDAGPVAANPDGSYTLTAAQLAGLSLQAPDDDTSSITLQVQAHASEGGNTADAAVQTLSIAVNALAEPPTLTAPAQIGGPANAPLPLDITDALSEIDPDSSLTSLTISGVPAGVSLSTGTAAAGPNGTTTWTLTPDQLTGLSLSADGTTPSFSLLVTAGTDDAGSLATSSVDIAVAISAPPTISVSVDGTAQEGQSLTATATTNESGTIHYQWQSSTDGFVSIINSIGTDSATYQVSEADENTQIRVVASFTDPSNQTASAASTPTVTVVDAAPTVTTPIITGTAQEGQTLSVAASAGQTDNAVSYVWYSSADNYTNAIANGATYQVQEKDEGATLEAKATVTNDNGATVTATSAPTTPVIDDASLSVALSVLGNNAAQQGQILSASATITGDADDLAAPISYQWQRSSDGGTTWVNVPATTTGTINNVVSSLYQLGEGDEGSIVRAVASFTDDTGHVVSAASTPTAKVADVTPVVSVPFSYAVDDFKVVKGSTTFDDNFSNGPPPVAGLFGTSPVAFATNVGANASSWTESGGKAIMSSSGAMLNGAGAFVQALLITNTQPEGTGSGLSNSGLKEDGTFTMSSTFDLATPVAGGGGYGIDLTNGAPGVAQTAAVELMVQRSTAGGDNIVLLQFNSSTNTFQQIANQVLTPQQVSGNTQIELDLAHNTANSATVTASFELLDNGTQTGATIFTSTPAQAFTAQTTFTRAAVFATAAAALISGTAQEGKTLTAQASANDSDATLSYQWQTSGDGTTWSNITGATNSTYGVQEGDENNFLRVAVTSTDTDGNTASFVSAATAKVVDATPTVSTPVITGNAQEGQTLTASATAGEADDSISYAWYSSQSGYTVQIGSGATYVPQEADERNFLEVKATVTNDNGVTASAVSVPPVLVTDAAPTVTTPTISGILQEGQTLTASASAGDADDTISYTWYTSADNDTNPIGFGPTLVIPESADSLVVTTPDGLLTVVDRHTIEVKATVVNDNGVSVSAMSAPTPGVADAAPFVSTPTIFGTAQEGQTLFASASAGQPDNKVTYQWFNSSGAQIGTGATYQVKESDEGSTITVEATATNEDGLTASQTSDPTATVTDAPPQFVDFPSINNPISPEEGETLVASATAAQSDNTITYAWYSSADDFTTPIGTGDSYTLQESDETHVITVKATITNDDGAMNAAFSNVTTAIANTTGIVGDAPAAVNTPAIAGIAQEGQVLTAAAAATQDGDDSPVVYLWYSSRDGFSGPIAAGPTYLVQEADEGFSIGVRAIAFNEDSGITSQGSVTSPLASVGIAFDADDNNPNQPDNDPNLNGKIVGGHQYFNVSNSNILLAANATVVGNSNFITPGNATVTLSPSSGNVIEGDGENVIASLATFNLAGNGDTITGSSDTINAAPDTTVNLDGTSDTVNGNGIAINASDTFVTLTGVGDQLAGQNDIVVLTSNAADVTINGDAQAIFYAPSANPGHLTLNGSNDLISAPTNTVINLQDNANLIVVNGGANDTVNGNGVTVNGQINGLTLTGAGDTVEGFASTVNLPDDSGVTVDADGFTVISGDDENIIVPDPTSLILTGSGDTISGDGVNIQMQDGSTATLLLADQDFVSGTNETLNADNMTINLAGIDNGQITAITVVGSNDTIALPAANGPTTGAVVTVQGTDDILEGGQGMTVNFTGADETISGPTNDVINLQDGANLTVTNGGTNDTINGNGVTINGQINGLTLTGSNDTVEGFSNIINLPDGSGVTLTNVDGLTTISGNNETINAPNATLMLTGSGDTVIGSNAVVQSPNGGSVTLLGNNDQVYGANEIVYVNNEAVQLGSFNGGTNPLIGDTIVGSNDQITMPVQTPSAATSLTVEGTNDTLFGNGEAVTIANGSSIQYTAIFGTTVTFGGPSGTLQLASAGVFDPSQQNAVAGFSGQDQIDIGGLVYTQGTTTANFTENAAGTAGILTVTGSDARANLLLFGDYTTGNFALASDGHGGTLVTDPPTPTQTQLASSHT